MRGRAPAGLVALAALLVAQIALAAPPASPEARRAKALFEEGVALSDEGKWTDALTAFQRSNELQASSVVRFNIGATLRALGRFVEARDVLQKTLDDDRKLKPGLQKDIEKLLAEVKAKVVDVAVKATPADGKLEMDGSPLAVAPTGHVEIDPGKHVFVLKAPGYDTTELAQTFAGARAELVIVAPKTQVVEKRVEVAVAVEKPRPVYARGWFLVTVGLLAAGGATTAVVLATRPSTQPPAGPPASSSDRVIPASYGVRF